MALHSITRLVTRNITCRCFISMDTNKIATAGIIVIGDEILKGEVADTNSTYLALELHKLGLQLKKISVIGDDVKQVSQEVKQFAGLYDYVLTSGGIGPTHDDVTYEAVAVAFNVPLILDPNLRDICMKFYNTHDISCPGMKLAYIPKSAKLNFNTSKGEKISYPNVSINNVYMFPGIPQFLIKTFSSLKDDLFKSHKKFYSKYIYFNITEEKIAKVLQTLVKEYPDVQFGSYPKLLNRLYKVKVTIESCSEEDTSRAYNRLLTLMPKHSIVDMDNK